jgi:signal transduction histidine kinase
LNTEKTHGRKVDGTALGLSLCREIAIAGNGKLQFSVTRQNTVTVVFRAHTASKGV